MSISTACGLRLLRVLAAGGAVVLGAGLVEAQEPPIATSGRPAALDPNGHIGLHSLMSLSDTHLQNVAHILTVLSTTDAVRSGEWERIRQPLSEAARLNPPAVHWFALPDGTYWTLDEGRIATTLADRPYFPRVLAGKIVIGDLVVSRATGKSTAIVAVPVRRPDGGIAGVLGASVHLDRLSLQIRQEMALQPHQVFYSLDATPVVGLHSDPEIVFLRPLEEGDPALARAIREMISREEGVATYSFRGKERTVLYRKSPVTGWWYAFGVMRQ